MMDNFKSFNVIFIVMLIAVLSIFVFTIAVMFSPKLRARMMEKQVKAVKHVVDNNEDDLRDMSTKGANITKDATTITAKAIRDGLVGKKKYCKHCGALIDEDSTFCKDCGKKNV